MKKFLLILGSLVLLSTCVFAQAPSKNKATNSSTITKSEVILTPSSQITKPKTPTQGSEVDPVSIQSQTNTRLVKGSTASTLSNATPWSALTIAEQINLITKEIELLKKSKTDPLRLEKQEQLLERKKLQNSLQIAP